jgi:hypothetical protein
MADTKGVKTIKQVVDGLLALKRASNGEYFRYYQMAINAYRELRLFHINERAFIKLTMDALNRVTLPDDFISFLSLSVPNNGKLYTLTRDDLIIPTKSGTAPSQTLDATDGEGVPINSIAYAGYMMRGGVNQDGYYTFDWENRQIILNGCERGEVILGYVSSGVSTTSTYVPAQAVPAIEKFIMWNDKMYMDEAPAKIDYYKSLYDEEIDKLRMLEMPTFDEFRDEILRNMTPLPRR